MVKNLSKIVESAYSTQERAFALLSLGKAASTNSDSNVQVEVIIDGKTIGTFKDNNLTISDKSLNAASINLVAKGSGKVYYHWETEGVKKGEPIADKDSYMKIRKKYYNYKTEIEITDNKFKQGDLIVAKISLTGFENSAQNIVISDLVPAGFEIENPRLENNAKLNWSEDNILPIDYLDIRDDRLLLFTSLSRKTSKDYYYLLRVVSSGKFIQPAIVAEAMYDGEIHSSNGLKIIEIIK
jgi:hypothetical protein